MGLFSFYFVYFVYFVTAELINSLGFSISMSCVAYALLSKAFLRIFFIKIPLSQTVMHFWTFAFYLSLHPKKTWRQQAFRWYFPKLARQHCVSLLYLLWVLSSFICFLTSSRLTVFKIRSLLHILEFLEANEPEMIVILDWQGGSIVFPDSPSSSMKVFIYCWPLSRTGRYSHERFLFTSQVLQSLTFSANLAKWSNSSFFLVTTENNFHDKTMLFRI